MYRTTYAGLSNQGAVCYMNSLLQTLFMTKELRRRLYRWQIEETPGNRQEESIPYQLQELFGRLQLTQQSVVDTKGLIRSFRWDSMETFIQNDVQEFCRVLFDAIERSAPRSSLVSSLFQGLLLDYVRCQSCLSESHREDQFLDLSLAIRSESGRTAYNSLEKALEAFIRPETLTGSNQYYCSICNRKTDAIKGLRFQSFPQILMIQLKRFDLDMETMRRRKLEDYVEFPLEVDLGKYVVGKWRSRRAREGGIEGKERAKMAYVINPLFRPLHPGSDHSSLSPSPASLPPSPSLYSLYSVLVHSGSVAGGHYYAYIKSFEDNRWYRFNDAQVTKASEADLKSTYGGKDGTAYLLVYQKKGEEAGRVEDWEVPEAVRRVVEEEKRKAKEARKEALERANLVAVRFFYKGQEKTLEFPGTQSISSLLPSIQTHFHLSADIRLRKYQPFNGTTTDVLGETDTLEGLGYGALVVEERREDGAFVEFQQGDFQLKVVPWRDEVCNSPHLTYSEKTCSPLPFPANLSSPWVSVLSQLHISLYPSSPSILVQRRTYIGQGLEVLSDRTDLATVTVGELRLSESSVLLAEPWESASDLQLSKWRLEVQLDTYRAEIRFNAFGESQSFRELRQRVLVDLRSTVGELKLTVAETIQEDCSSFILRKGLSRQGAELKDLSQSLSQAGLSFTAAIYIERALPLLADHIRVYVSLIAPPSPRLGFTAVASLWEICQLAVHWATPATTVKEMVISASRKRFPTLNLPASRLFLRNLVQNRPGSVLVATNSIAAGPEEGEKAIGVQIVEEEAGEWRPNMLLLGVKMWSEAGGLGQIRYFAVEKDWNWLQFGAFLSQTHSIALPSLLLQVIACPALFQQADLHTEPWLCPHAQPHSVLSLGLDSLLVVRDRTQAVKLNLQALSAPERPLVIRLKGE